MGAALTRSGDVVYGSHVGEYPGLRIWRVEDADDGAGSPARILVQGLPQRICGVRSTAAGRWLLCWSRQELLRVPWPAGAEDLEPGPARWIDVQPDQRWWWPHSREELVEVSPAGDALLCRTARGALARWQPETGALSWLGPAPQPPGGSSEPG